MALNTERQSFPRKRESSSWPAHFRRFAEWIPAFAGMTAPFEDAGSGRLAIALQGEFTISPEQIKVLKNQFKERMPAR